MFEPVHAVRHQDDVEVGDGLQDRNVGDQHSGVFSALLLYVVQVRYGEGDCMVTDIHREETVAVMMRVMSIAIPKKAASCPTTDSVILL